MVRLDCPRPLRNTTRDCPPRCTSTPPAPHTPQPAPCARLQLLRIEEEGAYSGLVSGRAGGREAGQPPGRPREREQDRPRQQQPRGAWGGDEENEEYEGAGWDEGAYGPDLRTAAADLDARCGTDWGHSRLRRSWCCGVPWLHPASAVATHPTRRPAAEPPS
jgi:hypothetical protein